MQRLILSLLVMILMIIVSGCGDDKSNVDVNKTTDNASVTQEQRSSEPPIGNNEIFVGKSDITGRDCYLLTDSIKFYNNEQNLDCTIKMVKTDNDIQYLNYKFIRNGSYVMFETNQGFSGRVDKKETPIEYQTYATVIRNYSGMQQHPGENKHIQNINSESKNKEDRVEKILELSNRARNITYTFTEKTKEVYCVTEYHNGSPFYHWYLIVDSVSGNKNEFQCFWKYVYAPEPSAYNYIGYIFETTSDGIFFYSSGGAFEPIKSDQELPYYFYLKSLEYLK